ncbi:MAG: hypothetical protein CSA70_02200 [Rhodobacterales bacterium]|nr:MAG: hypothetical protein CSA70_02200 [Rhodobacterales bacterium]
MTLYEYKVLPAPRKGTKAKGVKAPEARFSLSLQTLMNELAAEGWEFQRAETLPSEERTGLTGSTTVYRDVLVFRRPRPEQVESVGGQPPVVTPEEHPEPIESTEEIMEFDTPETAPDPPEHRTETQVETRG